MKLSIEKLGENKFILNEARGSVNLPRGQFESLVAACLSMVSRLEPTEGEKAFTAARQEYKRLS